MKPPIRMRDDPGTPPELLADLRRSESAASEYDVAAGLIGLQAAIGASLPASGTSAAPGSAGTAAGATKLGLISALSGGAIKAALVGVMATAGAAGLTAWWLDAASSKPTPPQPSRTDVAPLAAAERPASPALDAPAVASPANNAPRVEAAREPAPVLSAEPAPHLAPVPGEDPVQLALRDEIAQLGRIKALVDDDPQRAYELARAGDREFVPGILRHERAALAVRALWNMGSRDQAQRDARRFLERYPESPLRPRIEQLLEESH